MEETLLFSTLKLFNMETPRLECQNRVARKIGAIIEEMTNKLENFGFGLQLQKMRLKKELINWKSLL